MEKHFFINNFKKLYFSKLIFIFGIIELSIIAIEFLKIFPDYFRMYLVGFGFITSPILFVLSFISIGMTIIKYISNKNISNSFFELLFSSIGLLPSTLYFGIICFFGY